jgi:hypothetical protein
MLFSNETFGGLSKQRSNSYMNREKMLHEQLEQHQKMAAEIQAKAS